MIISKPDPYTVPWRQDPTDATRVYTSDDRFVTQTTNRRAAYHLVFLHNLSLTKKS